MKIVIGQDFFGFKVKERRLRFDVRNKFLTQRVVRNSNKLPKETLDAPFLKALKARLDGTLVILIWRMATMSRAGGWN